MQSDEGLASSWECLILSFLHISTDTFANSVGTDEMACNEQSHQDLHCLPFCFLILIETPVCKKWMCPNSEMEESISKTQGWKV